MSDDIAENITPPYEAPDPYDEFMSWVASDSPVNWAPEAWQEALTLCRSAQREDADREDAKAAKDAVAALFPEHGPSKPEPEPEPEHEHAHKGKH